MTEANQIGTVKQAIFTGGEPMLFQDDLMEGISFATSLGWSSRVVTNGGWGKSFSVALKKLDQLIACGLTELNISIDDLHQKWIPLEYVKNVFEACQRRKFGCLIAHKTTADSIITKDYLEKYFGTPLVVHEKGKNYNDDEGSRLIMSGNVVPVGREPMDDELKGNLTYSPYYENCESILDHLIISPNHTMRACCGIVSRSIPELELGDLREQSMLEILTQANDDLILNWLALEGPFAIANFAKEKNPLISFATDYVGICHLCNDIFTRKDVRQILEENISEIKNRLIFHKMFFENIRSNKKLIDLYMR